MRKLLTLLFCTVLIFSSVSPAVPAGPTSISAVHNISETHFSDPFAPLAKLGNWIKRLFGKKKRELYCDLPPGVIGLELNKMEIVKRCPGSAEERDTIEVLSTAPPPIDVNKPLIYTYHVTGGEIVGRGPRVVWDLSGVTPGTYVITAGVDGGAGVIGKTFTRSVKVTPCEAPPDEKIKPE